MTGAVKRTAKKVFEFSDNAGLLMVVGNYGSGKTEVAVNLALGLAGRGIATTIADLDIVNPYFRCREARQLMEEHGIRVVAPPPAMAWADLPIMVPEIKEMLHPAPGAASLFDVGGEDTGARLLSTLVEPLDGAPYELWQVLNARRPFTSTVAGCLKLKDDIENASRLRVTGLVGNTHLMAETTPEVILEGWQLVSQVARETGLPVKFITAMDDLADDEQLQEVKAPILRLQRYMLPPWTRPEDTPAGSQAEARAKPIGRP